MKPKTPPPPPPPAAAPTEMTAEPAADAEMRKQRRRSGYQSTILTGSLGPGKGKTVLG